jgi:hypothetical protein
MGGDKSVMIAHTLVSDDGKQSKIPVQVLNLTTEEMIIPINKKIVQITPAVHISALLDDKANTPPHSICLTDKSPINT